MSWGTAAVATHGTVALRLLLRLRWANRPAPLGRSCIFARHTDACRRCRPVLGRIEGRTSVGPICSPISACAEPGRALRPPMPWLCAHPAGMQRTVAKFSQVPSSSLLVSAAVTQEAFKRTALSVRGGLFISRRLQPRKMIRGMTLHGLHNLLLESFKLKLDAYLPMTCMPALTPKPSLGSCMGRSFHFRCSWHPVHPKATARTHPFAWCARGSCPWPAKTQILHSTEADSRMQVERHTTRGLVLVCRDCNGRQLAAGK